MRIYKIEASQNPNMFCICLIDRHALISVNNSDNWKHIKKYIDKPRDKSNNCSICYETQRCNIITCNKCVADVCIYCTIEILERNQGAVPCPFCRHVVGCNTHLLQ